MKRLPRRFSGRFGAALWIVGLVTVTLLTSLALNDGSAGIPPAPVGHGRLTGAEVPAVEYNATPCGVFALLYPEGSLPYYANFSIMFSELCPTPEFVYYYDGLTFPNGSFVVGWGGQIGGVPNLYFALNWVANCTNASDAWAGADCSFQASWTGYLSNNSIWGPYLHEGPLISTGGPAVAGATPTPIAWVPWWLLAIGGVGAALVCGVGLFALRRRTVQREAILLDESHPPAAVPASPAVSGPSGATSAQDPVENAEDASTADSLEDLY